MTTKNDMPAEIYVSNGHTRAVSETPHPEYWEQAKYIRADLTQPSGDVGEALDALNWLQENFEYCLPSPVIDEKCNVIKRALSQQPDAGLLEAINPIILKAKYLVEFCWQKNKESKRHPNDLGISMDLNCGIIYKIYDAISRAEQKGQHHSRIVEALKAENVTLTNELYQHRKRLFPYGMNEVVELKKRIAELESILEARGM